MVWRILSCLDRRQGLISPPGSRARRWIELAESLEELLGRPVDLVNPHYIRNPYFLRSVNQSRTVVYDRQSTQVKTSML